MTKNIINFPDMTNWISARSSSGELLQDVNCSIILPKIISSIAKVLVKFGSIKFPVAITGSALNPYTTSDFDGKYVKIDGELVPISSLEGLDITEYVVEQTKKITLRIPALTGITIDSLDVAPNRANTASFLLYGNDIDLVNQRNGGAITFPTFTLMIISAFVSKYGKSIYFRNGDKYCDITLPSGSRISDPRDALFRITYTPLGESTKIDIPKTEPQNVAFSIPYNQQQQIISNLGQGKAAQITANMMGVEKREVVRYLTNPKKRLPLYTTCREGNDVWVLIAHELTIANARTIDKETWAKNWAAQSQFVGVNRQARTWETPAEIVERNIKANEYLVITSKMNLAFPLAKVTPMLTPKALEV